MLLRFAFTTLVLISTTAEAGSLRKVWDFDARAPGVYALSFSPDGRYVAAAVGRSWQDEFVLILDVTGPQANRRRLDINPDILDVGPYARHHSWWSPSGRELVLGHTRVQLLDGKACSLPDAVFYPGYLFVGQDRLVAQSSKPIGTLLAGPASTRLGQLFLILSTSHCGSEGSWNPGQEYLLDASADRGLVCVRQGSGTSILDAVSWTLLQRLPAFSEPGPPWSDGAEFAEEGKAVCGITGPEWQQSASCFDVDTGKQLATSRRLTELDIAAALHAPRVVLTDYGRAFDFIDFRWTLGSIKNRIVWDFGTGKELVSWHPRSQSVIVAGPTRRVGRPYVFDISPDGDYIVEGGAGTVSLYRIEP
jgi:WD40 repeat protein